MQAAEEMEVRRKRMKGGKPGQCDEEPAVI